LSWATFFGSWYATFKNSFLAAPCNNLVKGKRTGIMPEGSNGHVTTHKGGGDSDLQELEEPETLNVVIDGTSPSDYPDEGKRKRWRPRILLAVSALVVVSVVLGVSFGLTTKKNSSVNEFINGLPSYSLELASNNASSPQAEALTWLQKDPQYNEYELHRLYQRYALAVLYYSTNGEWWNYTRGWMSNDNECSWFQYDDIGGEADTPCKEASRLSSLNLFQNDLGGTVPTELELLTDLEIMLLLGDALSGMVHSEL
jgi:hypothetical protein